jgi:hypothetical protein
MSNEKKETDEQIKHIFHGECLKEWLKVKIECPV